jgi:hypothetical protein
MKSIGVLNYSIDGINSTSLTIPSGYTSGGTISLTDDIQNEVDIQEDLIKTISTVLESKAAGLAEITVTDLRYSA